MKPLTTNYKVVVAIDPAAPEYDLPAWPYRMGANLTLALVIVCNMIIWGSILSR
jgi:hypothetical protein